MYRTRVIPRKPDPRFSLHRVQPRAKHLTAKLRKVCLRDHAFSEALRVRVSSAARWAAFIEGRAHYPGKECNRCHTTARRPVDGSCYACMLARNAADFGLIRIRQCPPAMRSVDSWRDRQARKRRERNGEHREYRVGQYVARQYPSGRVALTAAMRGWEHGDLQQAVTPETLYRYAEADPDLRQILVLIGWAQRADMSHQRGEESGEQGATVPALPEWLGSIQVRAHASVQAGAPLGGPVQIVVRQRDGYGYVAQLNYLESRVRDALLAHYWHDIPACIRALGDTPEQAYAMYVAGKRRGYLRGPTAR